MIDLTKLPTHLRDALRQRHGLKPNDPADDHLIAQLTPDKAFAEFCEWHGLCGWGEDLIDALHGYEAAIVVPETPLTSISSQLAAMMLQKALDEGKTISIPSLGIEITQPEKTA